MDNLHCPKCGCTDIHITEKGYSVKKGLLGYIAIGAIGTLFGVHGNKRVLCVCLKCNHTFTPSDGYNYVPKVTNISSIETEPIIKPTVEPKATYIKSAPPKVTQIVKCSCGAFNSIYNKHCFSCDKTIDLSTMETINNPVDSITYCQCNTKNDTTHKYCIGCGIMIDYRTLTPYTGKIQHNMQRCPACGKDTPSKSRKVKYCAHCGFELL